MPSKCTCAKAALEFDSTLLQLRTQAIFVIDDVLRDLADRDLLVLAKRVWEKIDDNVNAERAKREADALFK